MRPRAPGYVRNVPCYSRRAKLSRIRPNTLAPAPLRTAERASHDICNIREFVRTHRSTLVRKKAVKGLHPLFHGDYIVKLVNGAEVPLSRSFRGSFFREMSR